MIKNESVRNNRLVRHCFYFAETVLKGSALRKKAEKLVKRFQGYDLSGVDQKKLIADMLRMHALHGYGFDEYLVYRFYGKPMRERLSFISDWEHMGYACAVNDPKNDAIFDNKWNTYRRFRSFFGREIALCEGGEGEATYKQFISAHPEYVVKPLDASCGQGVKVIRAGTPQPQYSEIVKDVKGSFLVEELIHQVPETAKFHEASLNTVRVPAIRIDEKTKIIHPFFRVGQHGNTVDNAGAGGIICEMDPETGRIFAAMTENGREFTVHPDTGEQIIGFTIPRWEEAKRFVAELSAVLPENHYTGWDIALTEKGWVIVEANRRGQFVWQITSQVGSREEFDGYLRALGTRY